MNLHATEARDDEQSQGAAMKFTYASGSRPLEGYTVKRGVGRGGFGEVYYAVSDAGKEVALKLIRRHLEVELRGVRQCLNLKHPNLLAIHDIRTDENDDRWVVMEYISGQSLDQVIDRNPNGMPLAEVTQWMSGIAAGVAHLHDHGIVHRDLKPGNIFFDEGIIKIGDYGLSKFVSCSRRSGQTESVGTVHYMAPEIANGRYGKEIDTYALGVILYEMLTGRVPFEGESVGEVLMKHLTAEPDLSALHEPFRSLVEQALAKDPSRRIASAKHLYERLPGVSVEPIPGSGFAASAAATSFAAEPSQPAFMPPHEEAVHVEAVDDEEPIWRMIRDACRQVNEQWTSANIHPALKVVLLLAGVFLALGSASMWFPLMFVAVMCYGVYRVVRSLVVSAHTPRLPQPPPPQAVATDEPLTDVKLAGHHHSRRRTQSWRHEKPTTALVTKTPREKLTELTGSMLLAAGIAGAMSVVMMVLRRGETMQLPELVWMAMVGTIGAWAVMIPSKFWEGLRGEQVPRRFTMLVFGLLVGAAAFALSGFLQVELPYGGPQMEIQSPLRSHMPENFYQVDGAPGLPVYLAYFGFLFLILRWWRQADPARGVRFSLWSIFCCVFAAWLLNIFWPFPQPWGFMLSAVVAVSVQLASPWVAVRGNE